MLWLCPPALLLALAPEPDSQASPVAASQVAFQVAFQDKTAPFPRRGKYVGKADCADKKDCNKDPACS